MQHLDIVNKKLLLSRLFCYSKLVWLFGFSLRKASHRGYSIAALLTFLTSLTGFKELHVRCELSNSCNFGLV